MTAITDTTAQAAEELYDIVVFLYTKYLNALAAYLEVIPENNHRLIKEVHIEVKKVQEAMEHDLALFDQAVSMDLEDLNKIHEGLKIKEIYQQLNQNA